MTNIFLTTIGLEIHCVLNTKSKMFSDAKNQFNLEPNVNLSPFDLALPGVLPSVNKEAVKKSIVLANSLNMEINSLLRFDRKNYFYQDLPKGYQITQKFFPIGTNGYIKTNDNKKILIKEIHIEEDTAKEIYDNEGNILLDYNRSGAPLIEIVTEPVIHSPSEAINFLNKLKQILTFMNISDGKMENGSLRVDLNISISPQNSNNHGTKVEIKNLNSFTNIENAIEYEIKRQSEIILKNQEIKQETRKWNEQTNKTEFMRLKSDETKYTYFREPNIIAIQLPKEFIKKTINDANKHPDQIKNELTELNIKPEIINLLLNDFELYKIFINVYNNTHDVNLTLSWVVNELVSYLKDKKIPYSKIDNKILKLISKMINLISQNKLNKKQAKLLFPEMIDTLKEPELLMKEKGFIQIIDKSIITELFKKIINENKSMLDQYDSRKERVLKFYMGLLMSKTKGQANPVIANEILTQIIQEFIKK